jgi:hypothetical protein
MSLTSSLGFPGTVDRGIRMERQILLLGHLGRLGDLLSHGPIHRQLDRHQ